MIQLSTGVDTNIHTRCYSCGCIDTRNKMQVN